MTTFPVAWRCPQCGEDMAVINTATQYNCPKCGRVAAFTPPQVPPSGKPNFQGVQPTSVNHMKVLDSMWFTSMKGTCGMVLAEDEVTGKKRLYAGVVSGLDQSGDERDILSWGNKINILTLSSLISRALDDDEEDAPGGNLSAIIGGLNESN